MANHASQEPRKVQHSSPDVVALVDEVLKRAIESHASDVHFEPTSRELIVKFRLDGMLRVVDQLGKVLSENIITRLKVMAGLLTYRNDIPQEGRIEPSGTGGSNLMDQRVSIFPTIQGQRAVVRLFYEDGGLNELDKLGFSDFILSSLQKYY